MKALALALLLLQPAAILAAADKPNPADFPITVKVVSSGTQVYGNYVFQVLDTVIDNASVRLQGSSTGILRLGDYPARLSPKVHVPKDSKPYDIYRAYDLLFPDGTVRTYTVTGLGPAPANP